MQLLASNIPSVAKESIETAPTEHFHTDHLLADLRGKSVRGGVVTMAGQALRFPLQKVSVMILARLLTPADFGLVAMVTAITGFVAMFKDLGLSGATIQRSKITHAQVSFLFWVNCLVSIGVALLVAALSPLIARFYHEPRLTWITVALSATLFFSGLTVQHQALLRRQMKFKEIAIIDIVSMISSIVTAVVLALFGFRYWSLVGAQFATSMVYCALVWICCSWRPGGFHRGVGARPLLAFGGHLTGFNILNYLTRNFDNILIGRVLGSAPLGIYSKAYGLLLLPISQINMPMASVLLPALSRLQDRPQEYRNFYLRALGGLSLLTVPLVVFSFFFTRDVVLVLLGQKWLAVAPVFQLLAPAALVGAINVAPGWLCVSLGQPRKQLHYAIVSAPVCMTAFLIGIRWGIEGVATSFSLIFIFLLGAFIWYSTRNSPVTFSEIVGTFFMAFVPSCFAAVVAWLCYGRLIFGLHPLSALIVNGSLFAVLYLFSALVFKSNRRVIFKAVSAVHDGIRSFRRRSRTA